MRRRAAVATAVLAVALLVAAYAGARTESTLVALSGLRAPATFALLGWALAVVSVVLFRPRRRALVAVVAVGVPLVAFGVFAASLGMPPRSRLVAKTERAGEYDLRLVESWVFVDPWWEVRVRAHRGLLSREACLFVVTPPRRVHEFRFTGPHAVEVVDSDGGRHAVTFDPDSLASDRPC